MCRENGRVYVGYSMHVPTRLRAHKSRLFRQLHDNRLLQADYDLYERSAFVFETLPFPPDCTKTALLAAERQKLETFPSNLLYNVYRDNPFSGKSHTREAR